MNRQTILDRLRTGPTTIVFEKADGSIRTMTGTLQESLLPPRGPVDPNAQPRSVQENLIPIFDLESGSWKSFRLDRLRQVGDEQVVHGSAS